MRKLYLGSLLQSEEYVSIDGKIVKIDSSVHVSWCVPKKFGTILYSCGHCVPPGTILKKYRNAVLETSQEGASTEALEYAKFSIPNVWLEPWLEKGVLTNLFNAGFEVDEGSDVLVLGQANRIEPGTRVFNVCDGKVLVGIVKYCDHIQTKPDEVVIDPLNSESGLRPPYYGVVGCVTTTNKEDRDRRIHRVERALTVKVDPAIPVCVLTHQGYSGSPWFMIQNGRAFHVGTHIARSVWAKTKTVGKTVTSISDLCYVKPFPHENLHSFGPIHLASVKSNGI